MKKIIWPAIIGAFVVLIVITLFEASFGVEIVDTYIEFDASGASRQLEKSANIDRAAMQGGMKLASVVLLLSMFVAIGSWVKRA